MGIKTEHYSVCFAQNAYAGTFLRLMREPKRGSPKKNWWANIKKTLNLPPKPKSICMTDLIPDYLFEVSWEVCNKMGGIYTVITTKAPLLKGKLGDRLLFVGPDVWQLNTPSQDFEEDRSLYRSWREQAERDGLKVRIGRWNIPSRPVAILVDFASYIPQKDAILAQYWKESRVDSLSGGWDYVESLLFGYASAKVIAHFQRYYLSSRETVIAHFHEWMTGAGVLHLHHHAPSVGTVFTTHATVTGRSIAGNGLPLYDKFEEWDGDAAAAQFNTTAKHSLEKQAAHYADAFTTVSDLTAKECAQILAKPVDKVTPNGFDDNFVPNETDFETKRQTARAALRRVAEAVSGKPITDNALFIAISGRYEFKNKGIDVMLETLNRLYTQQEIVAFFLIPAGSQGVRYEVYERLNGQEIAKSNRSIGVLTHDIHHPDHDPILQTVAKNNLHTIDESVKIVFAPIYLNGRDGVFNLNYYDVLVGLDLTLFPSYYEPWGYTPLESVAFHIPTVTTTLTGFGLWVDSHLSAPESGIRVIPRNDTNTEEVIQEMLAYLHQFIAQTPAERAESRASAYRLSRLAVWSSLLPHYFDAYTLALQKAAARPAAPFSNEQTITYNMIETPTANQPKWHTLFVQSRLPQSLNGLERVANNLWWTWSHNALTLFQSIDADLWESTGHNPVAMLDELSFDRLNDLSNDATFIDRLKNVETDFDAYMAVKPKDGNPRIGYFCMEYGFHTSVKLYSGGLGILAGDYLKEASDCATDLTGVGLLYRYGYFKQDLSPRGEQINVYEHTRFTQMPVNPVRDADGNWVRVSLPLPGRTLYAKAWELKIGRISLYLLDTDITENNTEDRTITHNLYGGDNEHRLKQEMLLGLGGIKLLQALGKEVDIYHLNEGHAAFAGLERMSILVNEKGLSLDEAMEVVRSSALFTTHTPVPAGHDAFEEDQLRMYMANYARQLGLDWDVFMSLGRFHPKNTTEKFSMSVLACKTSQGINGVSKIHGIVSQRMLKPIWEGFAAEELHISSVTNGVHYPTWVANEWHQLYTKYFGKNFIYDQSNTDYWAKIQNCPDEELWTLRLRMKKKLLDYIKDKIRVDLTKRYVNPKVIFSIINAIDENALVVGFARRFATYKRASLLFYDLEKLAALVNDPHRPILFLFSGKAHPADKQGQDLIKQIVEISEMPQFRGKVIFLENYNMDLATHLVQGVDLWLNTPTRPLEASGTSGMKVTFNGSPNFSVLDGWWAEGHRDGAGWSLPEESTYEDTNLQNELDAQLIYDIFENEIAADYFTRNAKGVSTAWAYRMKRTIAEIAPEFSMKRMLDEYFEKYYFAQTARTRQFTAHNYQMAREMANWKRKILRSWNDITVIKREVYDSTNRSLPLGDTFDATISLQMNELSTEDIGVEWVFGRRRTDGYLNILAVKELVADKTNTSSATYTCSVKMNLAGVYEYGFRIFPKHAQLPHRQDFGLVKWI